VYWGNKSIGQNKFWVTAVALFIVSKRIIILCGTLRAALLRYVAALFPEMGRRCCLFVALAAAGL